MKRVLEEVGGECSSIIHKTEKSIYNKTKIRWMLLQYDHNVHTIESAKKILLEILQGLETMVEYTFPWKSKYNNKGIISTFNFLSFEQFLFIYGMIYERLAQNHIRIVSFQHNDTAKDTYRLYFIPNHYISSSSITNDIRRKFPHHLCSVIAAESFTILYITDYNVWEKIKSNLIQDRNCEIIKGRAI